MSKGSTLQERVRQFVIDKRAALGLSQTQFAEIVFGDKKKCKWVSEIERGRGISIETFGIIIEKLNCEIQIIEH